MEKFRIRCFHVDERGRRMKKKEENVGINKLRAWNEHDNDAACIFQLSYLCSQLTLCSRNWITIFGQNLFTSWDGTNSALSLPFLHDSQMISNW